jgi:hypothetical protein
VAVGLDIHISSVVTVRAVSLEALVLDMVGVWPRLTCGLVFRFGRK